MFMEQPSEHDDGIRLSVTLVLCSMLPCQTSKKPRHLSDLHELHNTLLISPRLRTTGVLSCSRTGES